MYSINWTKYLEDISILAFIIKTDALAYNITYNGIYGIPRGGLLPAVILSHELGIPLLESCNTTMPGTVLIVDDLVETGLVLKASLEAFKEFGWKTRTAVVYNKYGGKFADLCVEDIPLSDWVVFPYEKSENAVEDANTYYTSRKKVKLLEHNIKLKNADNVSVPMVTMHSDYFSLSEAKKRRVFTLLRRWIDKQETKLEEEREKE